MSQVDSILEAIDEKCDQIDELIAELPLPPAVKKQLASKVYELYAEVEGSLDLIPTDW